MQHKGIIKPIEKSINIKYENEDFFLDEEFKEKLDKYWNSLNGKFTRGEMFVVTEILDTKECISIKVKKTDYAHYIYAKHHEIEEKYICKNLWAGILLETNDNKYILGEMSEMTATKGELHVSGGSVDKEDIEGEIVNIESTMIRELKEEFNIDISDNEIVEYFIPKFLKYPSNLEEYSVGILYKGKLRISSKEFEEHYRKYKEYLLSIGGEIEFKEIFFVDKNENKIEEFFEKYGEKAQEFNKDLFMQDMNI